jgi:CRP/FNR family nitrogen fixation transcriptional regulator
MAQRPQPGYWKTAAIPVMNGLASSQPNRSQKPEKLALESEMEPTEQRFSDTAQRPITRCAKPSASRDALVLLEQFGTTIAVGRDLQIYSQGEEASSCYKILSGCVRIVHFKEDGRRQIDQFLMAGDLLGFDALGTHDFGAEAVTDVVLRRFLRRTVDKLAESNIALTRRLRDVTASSLHMAHARLLQLDRTSASERVARFLLDMAERLRSSCHIVLDLPMARSDIADHLGLTIETVSRVLAHLCLECTIGIGPTGRGRITIRDDMALQQVASGARA